MNAPFFVLDNGADTIKAGFGGDCKTIPNCIARGRDRRTFIGSNLEKCRDFAGISFRRPHERGYMVSWEAEKVIWDELFEDLKVDPAYTSLVLAEPPFVPPHLQHACDQIVFEEFGFESYTRQVGAGLASYADASAPAKECQLILDAGFSFSHAIPVARRKVCMHAIRRVNVGGKFLTNYLKETISFRHYNMMDEFFLINQVKEDVCFVSNNFKRDLETAQQKKNPLRVDYVLPDYSSTRRGYVRSSQPANQESEQILSLANERFTIPEVLFAPEELGMKLGGIAQMVLQAVATLPPDLRSLSLANIVLVGGTAALPGFRERVEQEVRALAPQEDTVSVHLAPNPITSIWQGGHAFARFPEAQDLRVTRAEYQEIGPAACTKFNADGCL